MALKNITFALKVITYQRAQWTNQGWSDLESELRHDVTQPGDRLLVVGGPGSGKSTLLRALSAKLPPHGKMKYVQRLRWFSHFFSQSSEQ